MNVSLDAPRLKLDRAGEHFEDLQTRVEDFVRHETDKVTVDDDTKRGLRLWVIEEPSNPSPKLGPIISDVLHNLRSALDFLATQLVIANRMKPTSANGFPIHETIREYVDKGLPMLERMSERVKTQIEAAQPYHRSNQKWRTDPLLLLNRWNNAYKHADFKLVLLSVKSGGGVGLPDDFAPNFGPIEGRTVLGVCAIPDPDVRMNYTPHLDVVVADAPLGDRSVLDSLQGFFGVVEELLQKLARAGSVPPPRKPGHTPDPPVFL